MLFHEGIKLERRIAPQYLRSQGADSNRPRGGNVVNEDEGSSRDQPRAAGRGRARCRPGDTLLAASARGPSRRQSRDRTGDNAGYSLTPVHLGKNPLMMPGDEETIPNTLPQAYHKPGLEGQA